MIIAKNHITFIRRQALTSLALLELATHNICDSLMK